MHTWYSFANTPILWANPFFGFSLNGNNLHSLAIRCTVIEMSCQGLAYALVNTHDCMTTIVLIAGLCFVMYAVVA